MPEGKIVLMATEVKEIILKTTKELYTIKNYRYSSFFAQQSVEKFLKDMCSAKREDTNLRIIRQSSYWTRRRKRPVNELRTSGWRKRRKNTLFLCIAQKIYNEC